jgi:hypothetical protein
VLPNGVWHLGCALEDNKTTFEGDFEMATTDHITTTSQVEISALNKYIKKKTEPINRKSMFHAGMEANGRISYGNGGPEVEWRPRFRRRTINTGAGNVADISFPQTVVHTKVTLPWRSYDLGESLTKFAKLATRGKEGWFKLAKDMLDQLTGDFIADFGPKYYLDGNATATNKDLHGLESWFSVSSTVTNSPLGNPNDTYAGKSTALGVSGSWTPETGQGYPTGTGYTEYNWWSPFVVDYHNTYFGGSSATWALQWQEALEYGMAYLELLQNVQVDVCLLSRRLLSQAKQSLQSSQRFTTSADSKIARLGHRMLEYEGLEIGSEYGIPESVGYCFRWSDLELMSMQDQLIAYKDDHDIKTSQDLFALDAYCNLRCQAPSFTMKLQGVSAAGTS